MADRGPKSPAGLGSSDGKLCYYRLLEYDFSIFGFLLSYLTADVFNFIS